MTSAKTVCVKSLSLLLIVAGTARSASADRAYWEKKLPLSTSTPGDIKYSVYCFRATGGYFTTNSKYHVVSEPSKERAVATATAWQKAGFRVGVIWLRNKEYSKAEVERKIAASYLKTFSKPLTSRMTGDASRQKDSSVSSRRTAAKQVATRNLNSTTQQQNSPTSGLAGSSWNAVHHNDGTRFSVKLQQNGTATLQFGRRAINVRWHESNGQLSIQDIEGSRGPWLRGTISQGTIDVYDGLHKEWTMTRR